MGWEQKSHFDSYGRKSPKEIVIEHSQEGKIVVDILKEKETLHIDEINVCSGSSTSAIAPAILNLELQNVIDGLPEENV